MKKFFRIILISVLITTLNTITSSAEEFFDGTICVTHAEEFTTPKYEGVHRFAPYITYATNPIVPNEGETTILVATFDAKNTHLGMPLLIHFSGNVATTGLNILSNETIIDKWYTYTVYMTETQKTSNPNPYKQLRIYKICRKELGHLNSFEEEYIVPTTTVPEAEQPLQTVAGWWNNYNITNATFLMRGTLSGTVGNIRFGWNCNCEEFATKDILNLSESEWKIKNIKVISNPTVKPVFTNAIETTDFIELKATNGKHTKTYRNVLVVKDLVSAVTIDTAKDFGFIFSKDGVRGKDYISFASDAIEGDGIFEFGMVMYNINPELNITAEKYVKYKLD